MRRWAWNLFLGCPHSQFTWQVSASYQQAAPHHNRVCVKGGDQLGSCLALGVVCQEAVSQWGSKQQWTKCFLFLNAEIDKKDDLTHLGFLPIAAWDKVLGAGSNLKKELRRQWWVSGKWVSEKEKAKTTTKTNNNKKRSVNEATTVSDGAQFLHDFWDFNEMQNEIFFPSFFLVLVESY